MRLIGCPACVHDRNALRLAFRNLQIRVVNSRKERTVLALKPALIGRIRTLLAITPPRPLNASSNFRVHQDREIRLNPPAQYAMEFKDRSTAQLSASGLIRLAGIGEAVAKHNLARSNCRKDDLAKMLRSRPKHEREFGVRIEACGAHVKQELPYAFSRRRSARLSRSDDIKSAFAKYGSQSFELRAFPAAIQAFKGNKRPSRGTHGLDDISRNSARGSGESSWAR
jgi:hypothetical protein